MDIEIDLKKLAEYYDGIDPLVIPLEEAMKRMVRFCERLHAMVEHIPPDQRKDLGTKLAEISQKIGALIRPFIESTGFTEDELLTLVERQEGFNEEMWRMMQESKHQIIDCVKKIATAMITLEPREEKKEVPKIDQKKPHQPPRSRWMKS